MIPGTRTKVEEELCEDESDAVMVCEPDSATGALKVDVKLPVPLVLGTPSVVASKVTVTLEAPENPDPVTVIEEPDTPLVGVTVIEEVTENVLEAVWEEASIAATV